MHSGSKALSLVFVSVRCCRWFNLRCRDCACFSVELDCQYFSSSSGSSNCLDDSQLFSFIASSRWLRATCGDHGRCDYAHGFSVCCFAASTSSPFAPLSDSSWFAPPSPRGLSGPVLGGVCRGWPCRRCWRFRRRAHGRCNGRGVVVVDS